MNILRASHLGMCFGVRDAIAMAMEEGREKPLTILGELVHNPTINQGLAERGIQIQHRLEDVATSTVMITAHGASKLAVQRALNRGHKVIEATCPLVRFAHQSLKELAAKGCHLIIIGKRQHVEVLGLTEDLEEYDVVASEEDIMQIKEQPFFGIVAQTTQPIDKVHALVDLIRKRFPNSEIQFRDTVCQPTKQRQSAAIELAKQCDIVVVIGGLHSNNTRELANTCQKHCNCVIQIQSADELKPFLFYNAKTIGITAGTSTPDIIIDTVEQRLREFSSDPIEERDELV